MMHLLAVVSSRIIRAFNWSRARVVARDKAKALTGFNTKAPFLLTQVLWNLLSNRQKLSDSG